MKKCLFFDRDGVINKRLVGSYVKSFDEFELNKNILPIFKFCDENDYIKIVVTNQQGIAKGYMTLEEVEYVHNQFNELLINQYNIKPFLDFFIASEIRDSPPFRRKPSPKMLVEAKEKYNIDLENSFMIGDMESDIISGNSAGVKTIYYSDKKLDTADLSSLNTDEIIRFIDKELIW